MSGGRSSRGARYVSPGVLELDTFEIPDPTSTQVVIEVDACGICGSDLHAFQHGFAVRPGQVLGHEVVGRVAGAGAETGLKDGERVCVRPLIPCLACERCLAGEIELCEGRSGNQIGFAAPGAFADALLVPRAVVGETVFRLDETVSDDGGALVEPLAVGSHAVRLARPAEGDTAVVYGLGTIGLGVVFFLRESGVGRIVALDPSPLRRERAQALGADIALDPLGEGSRKAVRSAVGGGAPGRGGADVAVECAGVEASLTGALGTLRNGGRLVIAALYGGALPVPVNTIVQRSLHVSGSLGYADEFPTVIAALADGRIDPEILISHRFSLDEIDAAFAAQLDRDRSLKVLVTP